MKTHRRFSGRPASGFNLPELMVSIALMGAILAATAVAMQGVFISYSENEDISAVTQTARVVLNRMITEIRTADSVASTGDSVNIIPPGNDEGLQECQYVVDGGVLYYNRWVNGTLTSTPLLSSTGEVELLGLQITRVTGVDGQTTYTKRITAVLTIRSGSNPLEITASACPRRNLVF